MTRHGDEAKTMPKPGMPALRQAAARAAAKPLYAALRDRLKDDILAGRRKPGTGLPSESELGATFRVSRITVRLALADLQKEGLVVKQHGKGSFVSHPPVALRLTQLKGLSESLAGAGRTIHTRILSLKQVEAHADAALALGVVPGAAITELRTLRYLDRKPLVLNRSWMPSDLGARIVKSDLANRDVLDIFEQDLGLSIGQADLSIGALNATAEHSRGLGVPVGTALVFMRRLVLAKDKRPLHLETSAYRGDMFSYSLTLKRGGR